MDVQGSPGRCSTNAKLNSSNDQWAKLGVKTLELDVVISANGPKLWSHDAYMSTDFYA
jgi:hypothetical protein